MTPSKASRVVLTEREPLQWAIDQCVKKELAIEVGTYYGGWTELLSNAYDQVITLQIMSDANLMHFYKTLSLLPSDNWADDDTEPDIIAKYMRSALPEKYHDRYDFNYMVEIVRDMKNVTPILTESPPTLDWHWKFDLCTIDISRFPVENLKQYNYWKQHANLGAMMLIGVYKLWPDDDVAMTLKQFMSSIDTHCDFVPVNDNYIYIKF